MKANLLSLKESFVWEDSLEDRGKQIEELNLAIVQARNFGDRVYKVPDLFDIQLSWGDFFEFLYTTEYDDIERVKRFPWLSQSQHTTLISLFNFFLSETDKSAHDLSSLESEFEGMNNSLTGIYSNSLQDIYIHNNESWCETHRKFTAKFGREERIKHNIYFEQFFVPQLSIDSNAINTMINRNQIHTIFKRLDVPKHLCENETLHGEQIQMHFNDKAKSALNIDGTWKHGGFDIPKEAGDQLIKWGFKLPNY